MKIKGLIVLLFFGSHAFAQVALKKAVPFSQYISPEILKNHLSIIAGADMEGRETATPGQKKAAAYIEHSLKSAGLRPAGDSNYQLFYPVYRDTIVSASLSIDNKVLTWTKDFNVPATNHNAGEWFGEVVYVNLNDSDWKQNKIDVTGKLVMFEPAGPKGQGKTRWMTGNLSALMKKGAAALLVIDTLEPAVLTGAMTLSKYPSKQLINYSIISPETAQMILKKGIDSSRLPAKVYKANVHMDYQEASQRLESSNVLGYIEGKSKKEEYLVISAHYDHMGKKDSLVWFGADDDGSGTATVITLANAFSKAKAAGYGPERSIVFILFSGEEKGLWGSETYTNSPLFPFDKTTATLNIDMVGRIDSTHIKNDTLNYVYLVGDNHISSELPELAKAANKLLQLELNPKFNDPKDPEKIYTRSDHYNFAKHGVPVVFFYDGGNADYHRVTDTVDKIDFDLMSKRAKLVFFMAWELANRSQMLVRDKDLKGIPTRAPR